MLSFAISLVSQNNDYQRAQAAAAEATALRLGITVKTMFCDGDAIEQSQQLLELIQPRASHGCPTGIVVQPAGTGLKQVAEAASRAGIGWAVLHKEVEYVTELFNKYKVPMFVVSSDHMEEGRIQARQTALLLPQGGLILCIMGPRSDSIAQRRFEGLSQAKPSNIQILTVSGKWTEQSGYDAIASWLRLHTSQKQPIGAIVSQNDVMAIGARNAFKAIAPGELRERLTKLPIIGCDGLPGSGQTLVKQGLLKATVIVPVLAGTGLEILANAMRTGTRPEEHTVVPPVSFPPLSDLTSSAKQI